VRPAQHAHPQRRLPGIAAIGRWYRACRPGCGYHPEAGTTVLEFAAIGVPSMYDYSLHLVASRPARVGDKLISTSFPNTSTRGFGSVDDCNVAVCLLPGTELAFEKEVQCETGMLLSWSLGHRVAKFPRVNKEQSNLHHDALEFPDGKTVLLTQLCKGQ